MSVLCVRVCVGESCVFLDGCFGCVCGCLHDGEELFDRRVCVTRSVISDALITLMCVQVNRR